MKFKERKCRVCGCTWNHACPGRCYWVEVDLCSACAGKEKGQAGAITPEKAYSSLKSAMDVYKKNGLDMSGKPITLLAEVAEAMLAGYEAYKPRLLTLRDVQCYQDCPALWVEERNPYSGWRYTNGIMNNYAHPDSVSAKYYGITWRCWTCEPTPEQKESVPWESCQELGEEGD